MNAPTEREHKPRRVRGSTFVLVLVGIAAVASFASFGVALRELRLLRDTDHYEIGASEIVWTRSGPKRHGLIISRLPPWNLHLDGRPPVAVLVAVDTKDVLAPAVLRRSTLDSNESGVLWTRADPFKKTQNRLEIVVDQKLFHSHRGEVAVRFEVPRPRRSFFVSFLFGCALAMLGLFGAIAAGWLRSERREWRVLMITTGSLVWLTAAATLTSAMFFPDPPWLFRDSDGASIDAFAAALDTPSVFAHDRLLADRANFDWYTPSYVAIVRTIHRTGLPYYSTRAVLGFASTLIGLPGFLFLFRRLSGSALFGFAAATVVWLMHDTYPPNEQWSPSMVLPRSVFAAFWPWVVLLMLNTRKRPERWWVVGVASALLLYIHPVSAPALTGAVCLGLLVGGRARLRRRAPAAVLAGAIALIVMTPFAWTYLSRETTTREDAAVTNSMAMRDAFETFRPSTVLVDTGEFLVERGRFWLLLGALPFLYRRRGQIEDLRLYAGFFAGYAVVTIGVPSVDWTASTLFDRPLFQVDLVRNLRYLDVGLLGILSVAVFELRRSWKGTIAFSVSWGESTIRTFAELSRAGLVGTLVLIAAYAPSVVDGLRSVSARLEQNARMLRGGPSEVPLARLELLTVVEAIRNADQIVAVPDDLDFARELGIPLAYIWKDSGTLSYTDPVAAARAATVIDETVLLLEPPISHEAARRAATLFEAPFLVLARSDVSRELEMRSEVIFKNERYVILSMAAVEHDVDCRDKEIEHECSAG